jgi:RHS repeat-associated protein
MLMPGRSGHSGSGGWTTSTGTSSLPTNLSYDSPRTSSSPAEYKATVSIEFLPGFESGEADSFEAYITTDNGSSGDGAGDQDYASGGGYRYGFNGKENDNDVKGEGNQQDYGMRIYDPRLGRFLSVDPIAREYPWYTPYQFAGNKPIWAVDLDGLEELISSAPVKYRVNQSGSKLHGYYPKGYNSNIYASALTNPTSESIQSFVIGYRADADVNIDWSKADAHGTIQSGSAIESKYGVAINPENVNLVTIPGNDKGQSHFEAMKAKGVTSGDLAVSLRIGAGGTVSQTAAAIIGDYGPQSQPGEQSPAANRSLGYKNGTGDNNIIYLVFPGTSKYLEAAIGTDKKGHLLRSPTNEDINKAYNSFRKDFFADANGKGTATQINNTKAYRTLLGRLQGESSKKLYDEADPSKREKQNALQQPPNNNRN